MENDTEGCNQSSQIKQHINCNYNMPTFSTLITTSNDHPDFDFDNLLESMEFDFNNLDDCNDLKENNMEIDFDNDPNIDNYTNVIPNNNLNYCSLYN